MNAHPPIITFIVVLIVIAEACQHWAITLSLLALFVIGWLRLSGAQRFGVGLAMVSAMFGSRGRW